MVRCGPWRAALLVLVGNLCCTSAARAETAGPDFRFEIRPLLAKNCFACHGPDESHRQADLRLDDREVAVDFGAIVPGAPDDSELVRRILSDDDQERMPPAETGRGLSADEIEKINQWIASGAEYSQHWSYEPPQRPAIPDVSQPDWCHNEIDRFILARLDQAGLRPELEADRYRLIRRLSLDLTGLPPTVAQVDEFVQDQRPDAYERLVDRLLSTPAYGEHWARKWLDLARYADTTGYEKDSTRKIWSYRDWVINALNADMPFDEFTMEQLAGDLLPGHPHGGSATRDQIIATAFHRNTMQNDEGGTDDEEYRVAAVIDRVNTTMQVWMGTTMGCCQCHSHKYDPFSHREYYEMFAFFNQTADADRYDQEPLLLTPTDKQRRLKAELDRELAETNRAHEALVKSLDDAHREWEQSVVAEIDWKLLRPSEVISKAGSQCSVLDDGSVLVKEPKADADTYTVRGSSELSRITAVRLEALAHESLPGGGPGHAADGGFVVSKVELLEEPIRAAENVKHVRVELPDRHDYLTMSEVQVFRGEENVARGGKATQSSTAYEGHARLAIDGSTHPHFATGRSISHTAFNDNPWWEVELAEPTRVDRVVLWNEDSHPYRMIGARVSLLDAERMPIWERTLLSSPDLTATFTVDDKALQFASAGATSERKGFPARHAIEYRDAKRHGWSPDPNADGPQGLVLGLERPFVAKDANQSEIGGQGSGDRGQGLRIVIDQQAQVGEHKRQTLGHFRVLVSDDPRAANAATVPAEIREIALAHSNKRTPEQAKKIAAYFQSLQPEIDRLVAAREDIQRRLTEEYKPDKTPIMKELPADQQRTTHMFIRGSFLSKGDVVTADTPEVFPKFPDDLPRNRLGLAKWLVSRNNPLTARVVANRHWEQLFGAGIVLTSEDFGSQGILPTHPELLDWLAVDLMEHGWSLKHLAKTIVMSAAYRQSSRITAEKLAVDPDNRLIPRGPRHRLSAEQIRDQALAVSGLLSAKIGGPSVMPPQPDGVWQVVYSDDRWLTSAGDDRYRRGLYTFWRRTSPYPSAMALDATSRETCTIRRIATNTPVAAFALLNDPVYIEAAQALARRIVAHDAADTAARMTFAFRQVLARQPAANELERLTALFESERQHYQADAEAATKIAANESNEDDESHNPAELAAWTVLSNVLLNLDETLNK
jgi:Protein of unknown function (DUF1553)/Protein of unknown function (DUF1549)/Planctomycete cytochrome C